MGTRVYERVTFIVGECELILAAEEGLWTDPKKLPLFADVILTHARGSDTSRALSDAFLSRFKDTYDNSEYGVWSLTSRELEEWLRLIGAS